MVRAAVVIQALLAVTLIVTVENVPKFTLMDVPLAGPAMVAPAETLQL